MITLAGSAGFIGSADGTGSAARFYYPHGVAVDSSGNVYVVDTFNNTIRKVTPGGVVTTLAGTDLVDGFADGTGSAARFNYPYGVAVDSSGNVYVTDSNNNTIRKVTPGGVVTTLAGTVGVIGFADGTGSAAQFANPSSVAVDSNGNVYVADTDNNTIRKVVIGTGNPPPDTTPLVVTAQPANQRDLGYGTSAYFAVSADGTGLSFQWYKGGKAIPGATGASLSVNDVTTANTGVYTCKVSNFAGKVITEAVVLSVVDPSLLIYKVAGNEKTNKVAKTIKSSVSGLLILDRAGQQGAFVWTGKQGKQKVYWVERRADLATHSTGPVVKSTTVVVADQTAGDHPDVEHNLVWLRGGDALVKLSAFDQTIAPAVMAGTIGRLTLGDNPIIQTLSVSLVLDKTKSTASRANSDDVEAAISRIVSVLNAAGYLEQ